jgi:hypothetical protein
MDQIKKLLHSKENTYQREETTYRMKKSLPVSLLTGNIQNMKRTQRIKYKKDK